MKNRVKRLGPGIVLCQRIPVDCEACSICPGNRTCSPHPAPPPPASNQGAGSPRSFYPAGEGVRRSLSAVLESIYCTLGLAISVSGLIQNLQNG